MEAIFLTVTNIFILSALYILVTLGFAFIFNMVGVFNIAHSSIFMASAYFGYLFIGAIGLNPWVGLIVVVALIALVGIVLERFLFRPFLGDFNSQIMVGLAVILIATTVVTIVVGHMNVIIPPLVEGSIGAPPYSISWTRFLTFLIGFIVLFAIVVFVNRTRWGVQMQAISQNMEAASLQGINIFRVTSIVFALGCALAAVAGVLMGSMYQLDPFMGQFTLVKILAIVIIAGVGSFNGIIFAGLIMGILYAVLPLFISGTYSDIVAVGAVMIILLIRPSGFFGRAVA